jgi:hypothetical protein
VTTIVEKKGEFGFIFGFLAAVLGFAAWRGLAGAPVLAAVLGVAAAGCLGVLIWWYRNPAPILTISPEEIWYGRIDQLAAGRRGVRCPRLDVRGRSP